MTENKSPEVIMAALMIHKQPNKSVLKSDLLT